MIRESARGWKFVVAGFGLEVKLRKKYAKPAKSNCEFVCAYDAQIMR